MLSRSIAQASRVVGGGLFRQNVPAMASRAASSAAQAQQAASSSATPQQSRSFSDRPKIDEPFVWDPEAHWKDPLFMDDQLTEDEIMIRDAAKKFTDEHLRTRVLFL